MRTLLQRGREKVRLTQFLNESSAAHLSRVNQMLSCVTLMIHVSQSDFAGNYLPVVARQQNMIVAGMSAKSDFIHAMKATSISANPA